MKKIIYGTLLLAICGACQKVNTDKSAKNKPDDTNHPYCIIGKKAKIKFPNMTAQVSYPNDSTLHWKTTNPKGKTDQGVEKMNYHKIDEHLHFVNWIEKDGFTVSQVIDTKTGHVKAYWSFDDDKGKGKRDAMFVDASFEFLP